MQQSSVLVALTKRLHFDCFYFIFNLTSTLSLYICSFCLDTCVTTKLISLFSVYKMTTHRFSAVSIMFCFKLCTFPPINKIQLFKLVSSWHKHSNKNCNVELFPTNNKIKGFFGTPCNKTVYKYCFFNIPILKRMYDFNLSKTYLNG